MALIVVGDLHLCNKENKIKYKQSTCVMDWISKQDFNNGDNELLLLGDVAEFNISYEVQGELRRWLSSLKFRKIIWVQGNHCVTIYDSLLNSFRDGEIKNLELITQPTIYEYQTLKCLLLPHYESVGTTYKDMYERYSNLYLEEEFNQKYDYIFGHICNETQKFSDGDKVCDLSKLKGKQLLGHIHSFNEKNGYLGSVIKNSSTEKDDKKYIAYITLSGCEFIEVPNFLSYITCEYGEFPKTETPLVLFQVNNAPSKNETECKYNAEYEGVCDIGFTKIITLRQKIMENGSVMSDEIDENLLFDNFAKEKELNSEVVDICKKVL